MVSSLTEAGASVTLEALELGAVDFITKPDGAVSLEMDTLAPRLVERFAPHRRRVCRSSLRLAERVRLRSGLAQPASAPAPRRRAPASPARRRIKAAPAAWSRAGRNLHRRTAGAGCRAVPAACRLSVADRGGAAHAGLLHRSLGPPARQAVRPQRDGSHALPMPLAPGNVYIGKGDADIIVSVRPDGPVVHGRSLAAGASLASERRSAGGERHAAFCARTG